MNISLWQIFFFFVFTLVKLDFFFEKTDLTEYLKE